MTSQRSAYYVTLFVLVVAIILVSRPGGRPASVGRRSPSVTTQTRRLRTRSRTAGRSSAPFALAGGLAAVGGSLLAANLQSVPSDRVFTVTDSLTLVAIVVIGGLGSVSGTVLGGLGHRVAGRLPRQRRRPPPDLEHRPRPAPRLPRRPGPDRLRRPGGDRRVDGGSPRSGAGEGAPRGACPHCRGPRAAARGGSCPAGHRRRCPLRWHPGRGRGLDRGAGRRDRRCDRHQRRREVDAHERHRRVLRRVRRNPPGWPGVTAALSPHRRAAAQGSAEFPGRTPLPRAHRPRDRPRRLEARSTPSSPLDCSRSLPPRAAGAADRSPTPTSSSTSSASVATPHATPPTSRPAPAASSRCAVC